jgi:hypothetical protein
MLKREVVLSGKEITHHYIQGLSFHLPQRESENLKSPPSSLQA